VNKNLILFIHGLGGSPTKTWGQFPQLIKEDEELFAFDTANFGYPTALLRFNPLSNNYPKIQLLAKALNTQIETKYTEYKNIIFVCHSIGGLVARKYIIEKLKSCTHQRCSGLILYSVPNNGSDLASLGNFISWNHIQLKQICRNSDLVESINNDWVSLGINNKISTCYIVAGLDKVVDTSNSEGFPGNNNIEYIVDKGHTDVVKPTHKDDDSFIIFKRYALAFSCDKLLNQPIHQNPYRGLEPFREEDALFFFGRETDTDKLCELVDNFPLVTIVGSSGSGKSSLISAGLKSKLNKRNGVEVKIFRPKDDPFVELSRALIPLIHDDAVSQATKVKSLAKDLENDNFDFEHLIYQIKNKKGISHFYLIIDQFEEIFTSNTTESTRQNFINLLFKSISQLQTHLNLVISLRVDYFSSLIQNYKLTEVLNNNKIYSIPPITASEQFNSIIEKPAIMANVHFEPHLVERIICDVKQSSLHNDSLENISLPLLEFTLSCLWDKQHNGLLTHSAYDDIGRVHHSLSRHAEEVFDKFKDSEKEQVKLIFTELVHFDENKRDTRQLLTKTQIGINNWPIITQLANERLVVTGRNEQTGEETAELVHEALIKYWQRLNTWMENDRPFRVWQNGLLSSVDDWKKSNNDESLLWRGNRLIDAKNKAATFHHRLSHDEKNFIQVSTDRCKLEEKEKNKLNELKAVNDELTRNKDVLIQVERAAALGQMSAQMVHVTRNPITSIGGVARILEKKIKDPEYQKYLNVIIHETARLESLLEDLFDFVAYEKPQKKQTPLYPLINKTLLLVQDLLEKHKISLILDMPAPEPSLLLDSHQIRMVFIQLIRNAIEAMPGGGELGIAVKYCESNLKIIISDTGIGIDGSELHKAMDYFYSTKSAGSGLGLPLVDRVIKSHNGEFKLLRRNNHKGMHAEIILPFMEE